MHHDVVAARKSADRTRVADDVAATLDRQAQPVHQIDNLLEQSWRCALRTRFRRDRWKRLRRAENLLMQMRLRGARLASLVLADHDRANRAILPRQAHHAHVGLEQMEEMLL